MVLWAKGTVNYPVVRAQIKKKIQSENQRIKKWKAHSATMVNSLRGRLGFGFKRD